jgi:hypothetical protein
VTRSQPTIDLPNPPSVPPEIQPTAFRVSYLGVWSSHPAFAAAKLRGMRRIAMTVGSLLLSGAVAFWWSTLEWKDIPTSVLSLSASIDRHARWMALGGCLLAFVISFLLVGALQIRASLVPQLRAYERGFGFARGLLAPVVLACITGALLFAGGWAAQSLWLKVALTAIALGPLPILVWYLDVAAKGAEEGEARIAQVGLPSLVGRISIVVAPFVALQVIGGLFAGDLSERIAAQLTSSVPGSWLVGDALTTDAPQWLRDVADGRYGETARQAWIGALTAIGPTVTDVTERLNAALGGTLEPLLRRCCQILSLLLLLPALLMALGLSVRIVGHAASTAEKHDPSLEREAANDPRRIGCLGRLLAPFAALISLVWHGQGSDTVRPDSAGQDDAAPPPQWAEELIMGEHDGVAAIRRAESDPGSHDVAAPSDDPTFDWLFGGLRPTVDQVAVVRLLHSSYIDLLRDWARSDRDALGQHADFLIESDGGAGASSTLDACAIAAVLSRGQRVLYLCPSEAAADQAVKRVEAVLSKARLSGFFAAGRLDRSRSGSWSKSSGLPDVVVATLREWEEFIHSGAVNESFLRATIFDTEVILVDDFGRGRGRATEAMHLPFVLDKHRLLLASQGRALQTVVVVPPVGPEVDCIAEILAKRLFGGDMIPRTCRLRRWTRPAQYVFDVLLRQEPEAARRALVALVRACLRRDELQVVVLKSGADPEKREAMEAGLGVDGRRPRVFVSVDEIDPAERGSVDAVFLRWGLRRDGAEAIAARLDDGGTVFFRLVQDGAGRPSGDDTVIPVLASARSRALALPHLRSAVALLPTKVPIERQLWTMMGLRADADLGCMRTGPNERLSLDPQAPTLLVDPPSGLVAATVGRRPYSREGEVFDFIARFDNHDRKAVSVPVDEPLRDEGRVGMSEDGAHLFLGQARGTVDMRRFARWENVRGVDIGLTDLALSDRLLHARNQQRYHAVSTVASNDATQPNRIKADFYHAEAHQLSVPVLDVAFTIEPDTEVEGPQAIVTASAEWYEFVASDRPVVQLTTIVGLANEEGLSGACDPMSFSMTVGASVMTIAMPMPLDQRRDWVRALFCGAWTSDLSKVSTDRAPRAFWPLLTAIMHAALRRLMPDLLSYARVMAFRPPADGAGAVIFFLEPLGTAGTAGEPFRAVLNRPALRERFVGALRDAMEAVRGASEAGRLRPFLMAPTYRAVLERFAHGYLDEEDLGEVEDLVALLGAATPASTRWIPTGAVGLIRSPDRERGRRWSPPRAGCAVDGYPAVRGETVLDGEAMRPSSPETNWRWTDMNSSIPFAWEGDTELIGNEAGEVPGIEYAIVLDDFRGVAREHLARFGYSPEELKAADDPIRYAAERGILVTDVVRPDYGWIVRQSVESLRGLARAIVAQAGGEVASDRAKITAIYSFVRSLRYEIPPTRPVCSSSAFSLRADSAQGASC